jgi:hypothetical protein
MQVPTPPMLEQWDMGIPQRIVETGDASWQWAGAWDAPKAARDGRPGRGRQTSAPGAEATLTFSGTAVTITGRAAQDAGRAEVVLDGRPARPIDGWIPERTHDDTLWHIYGLAPGPHTLRLRTTGTHDPRATDAVVHVTGAIVYDRKPQPVGPVR